MSRRREVGKREILPDAIYNSVKIAKFINNMTIDGKKSIASHIFYKALKYVMENLHVQDIKKLADESGHTDSDNLKATIDPKKLTPEQVLELALENVRPLVEVRSRRVGGATYQVPIEVRPARRDALAMRWIILYARQRSEKGMWMRLAKELLAAIAGQGSAVKKRQDVHKMANANQAFAHFIKAA